MRVNLIAAIHFLENPSTELLVMLESEFVKQWILEHIVFFILDQKHIAMLGTATHKWLIANRSD